MQSNDPIVDFCLVCDDIRQEMGLKLTILGLYGLLPRVQISLEKWGGAMEKLLFLVGSHGGTEAFLAKALILNPDESVLIESGAVQANSAGENTNAGVAFSFPMLVFKQQGRHQFVFLINDREAYRQPFVVKEGSIST
jgi:hypothetical protein